MAEGVGFEPTVGLLLLLISSQVPLTTQPPFHSFNFTDSARKYFARLRVRGKLIRRSLMTTQIAVAELRPGDLEKGERQTVEPQTAVVDWKRTFGDAMAIYLH